MRGISTTGPGEFNTRQVSGIYKTLVHNLERTASDLEQLLNMILNDPDLYSHKLYTFFDCHPLFQLFPDSQKILNIYRQEQAARIVQKTIQNQTIDASSSLL